MGGSVSIGRPPASTSGRHSEYGSRLVPVWTRPISVIFVCCFCDDSEESDTRRKEKTAGQGVSLQRGYQTVSLRPLHWIHTGHGRCPRGVQAVCTRSPGTCWHRE